MVNKEPSLNGKCLHCYEQYEDMEEAIGQLHHSRQIIETAHRIALLAPDRDEILTRAIAETKKIVELSLATSRNTKAYIELCSNIIQIMKEKIQQMFCLEEKIQLMLFFKKNLYSAATDTSVNGKMYGKHSFANLTKTTFSFAGYRI